MLISRRSEEKFPIPLSKIEEYRSKVVKEMKQLGATDAEIALIRTATIRNAIRNYRDPKDVAWSILQ